MAEPTIISVLVDPHAAIPDGVCLRYKAETSPRLVAAVSYAPDDGPDGWWDVGAAHADGTVDIASDSGDALGARVGGVWGVEVEDSGAGTSVLIWGGEHGLRLRLGALEVAETHLLLCDSDVRWVDEGGVPK